MFKGTLLLLLLPMIGISQTPLTEGQLWLANNRGEAVGQADSVITRNFFDAKWVDVRADFMLDPALDCWIVLQPDSGSASAFKIVNRELSPEVLTKITSLTSGANFLMVFQPRVQQKSQQKKNQLALRLL